MNGNILNINPIYGDPVDNPQIRQDGILDAIYSKDFLDINESTSFKYNPIIGYYGDTRRKSDGSIRTHTGFDYIAPKGTEVRAVHSGNVRWVRIGSSGCKIRQHLVDMGARKENLFSEDKCKNCSEKKKCYGIQVWLGWAEKQNGKSVTRYAFYAHLSKFSEKIWNVIKDKINEYDIDYNPKFEIDKIGEVIGYSGCTGNAYDMKDYQQHLHFECLDAKLKKENPNAIVKTNFVLLKQLDDVDLDIMDIANAIKPFLHDEMTINELREILLSKDNKKGEYIHIQN